MFKFKLCRQQKFNGWHSTLVDQALHLEEEAIDRRDLDLAHRHRRVRREIETLVFRDEGECEAGVAEAEAVAA